MLVKSPKNTAGHKSFRLFIKLTMKICLIGEWSTQIKQNHKPFLSSLALTCHQPVNKQNDSTSIGFVVLQVKLPLRDSYSLIVIHVVHWRHAVDTKKLAKKTFFYLLVQEDSKLNIWLIRLINQNATSKQFFSNSQGVSNIFSQ